ncbi:hypothetical protein PR202_ga13457 [Eleusine coracana subsp. coracana]|uniref:C3H1-type domain-containing protein n=1 Tax=Eleusine coracana subsp. coracana TaxID=191504 RepID=A0AAV5CEU8_ELECO|nr:hypothetical protein PR202_ga13457 [Eleusine coracana subsp. coracana]
MSDDDTSTGARGSACVNPALFPSAASSSKAGKGLSFVDAVPKPEKTLQPPRRLHLVPCLTIVALLGRLGAKRQQIEWRRSHVPSSGKGATRSEEMRGDKIALSSSLDSGGGYPGDQPLPSPIFSFDAQRGLPTHFAAAFGSKLIVTQPVLPATSEVKKKQIDERRECGDVHARRLRYGLGRGQITSTPFTSPSPAIGSSLCPLDHPSNCCTLRYLNSTARCGRGASCPNRHSSPSTSRPTRCAIFVSVGKPNAAAATFTFDTADGALENSSNGGVENAWKRHGPWVLPFAGRAYFDPDLDAWVGFSRDFRGRLCSCDVASAISHDSDGQCPGWKVSNERYFTDGSVEEHVGASLVYMGGRSRFCIVESFRINDGSADGMEEKDASRPSCHCWIRLTTFSLRYDRNGDLTTGNSRRVRCYKAPETASEPMIKYPVAFWM